jgi:hypothetical protein
VGPIGGCLSETGQVLYRNDNFFMVLAGESEKDEIPAVKIPAV